MISWWRTTSRKLVAMKSTLPVANSYHDRTPVFGHIPVAAHNQRYELPSSGSHHGNLCRLVQAFREHGHRDARLDPLGDWPGLVVAAANELEPIRYGLSEDDYYDDLGTVLPNAGPRGHRVADIVSYLRKIYCGTIALEFTYLPEEERQWFAGRAEPLIGDVALTDEEKRNVATLMLRSQAFDNFVATKFPTVKRYSGEGAESMLGFFHELFHRAAKSGTEHVVMCIPHRGRLNLLTTLLKYPHANMFRKMQGLKEFSDNIPSTGDVLSHLTSSVDLEFSDEARIHVTMLPNSSHLEAVNPVAVGKTRGRQLTLRDGSYSTADGDRNTKVLCLQVHGDAAFAAQGVVMEVLAMANVPHFTVGGSVHLIINNQIGFTTPAQRGRSSAYCSDIAKMIGAPVIHVNGNFPEDVIKTAILAFDYQQRFHKDVVVNLVCFRRWGHNEIDDPTFTNPAMYDIIQKRISVPDQYASALTGEGILSENEARKITDDHVKHLGGEYDSQQGSYTPPVSHLLGVKWRGFVPASSHITTWDTGMDVDLLRYIGAKSVNVPENFEVHRHLMKTHIEPRLHKLQSGKGLDWATAESLAIGSLLCQGYHVRLSGQDVGRGTFSQRHAMLVCQKSGDQYIPLNSISKKQKGFFEVANSILSEEAVLGFEYGMSVENPQHLVLWEAQFGDFFNGAQVIVDAFIVSGETKWLLQSGLVLLLPHGYDGAGPEHSSCRIERFLQLCDSKEDGVDGDNINLQIVHPTTPSQYFHLLRRQMVRNFRKPLAVVAPKLLLRLPAAVSDLEEFIPGTTFSPVLTDNKVSANSVKKVIFCSGKHFYVLQKRREELDVTDTAIVRLEALCPFPTFELQAEMVKYPNANSFIWSQEEHRNMGPWTFIAPRFEQQVGIKLSYSGRGPLATPAVGVGRLHQEDVVRILEEPFKK